MVSWWFIWQRIHLQCRRPGFDPWVGKMPWRRAQQPTPVFLPGDSPWTEEPGGLQSMASQRVGHDWVTNHSTAHSDCVLFYLFIFLAVLLTKWQCSVCLYFVPVMTVNPSKTVFFIFVTFIQANFCIPYIVSVQSSQKRYYDFKNTNIYAFKVDMSWFLSQWHTYEGWPNMMKNSWKLDNIKCVC